MNSTKRTICSIILTQERQPALIMYVLQKKCSNNCKKHPKNSAAISDVYGKTETETENGMQLINVIENKW